MNGVQELGLDPADYDAATLQVLWAAVKTGRATMAERAHFDLALSIAGIRLVRAVHVGRVHPSRVRWKYDGPRKTLDAAALLQDAAITPMGPPYLEVLATAKRDLKAGEVIDALGGYTVYGEAESAEVTAREGLLPIGVAVGCQLRHDVPKDRHLTYADVEIPPGRLVDRLRAEQDAVFGLKRAAA